MTKDEIVQEIELRLSYKRGTPDYRDPAFNENFWKHNHPVTDIEALILEALVLILKKLED